MLAHQSGHSEAAVDLIGKALALNDRIPEYHYNIGLAYGALGRFDAAATHNSRAIALRPEKLRIAAAKPEGVGENCVAGRVGDIAYLGDISLYKIMLDDGGVMTVSRANTGRSPDAAIGWDDAVWLTWTADAGVLLTS